jgi:predicted DNA-binding protein
MPVRTVTIKLPDSLALRLKQTVARRRATQSEVIREALAAHLAAPSVGSYLELVGDLAGSLRGGAPDLSSNKRRLKGFGR